MALRGCITSRWVNAVSRTLFQIGMNTATTRMSGLRLTTKDLASARKKVTIWPEFTEEAVTNCSVLSNSNAAR